MSRSNWKNKSLYIASFIKDELDDYGNLTPMYSKPIYIGKQNIQPLSGSVDVEEYGNRVSKIQKVLLDPFLKKDTTFTICDINKSNLFKINKLKISIFIRKKQKIKNYIKENDLAYLDGVTPENETNHGDNANYRVDSVRVQNKKIAIYFEKLPNK